VAVQPETSSSYLGSAPRVSRVRQGPGGCAEQHTTENSAVGGQKAVLESLFQVALLVGFLFCDDVVQLLASEDGYLIAAVSVVDTEVSQALVGLGGLAALGGCLQVEETGVCVLHANAPALHRGRAEDEGLAIAAV
jgi:hypothetical protein